VIGPFLIDGGAMWSSKNGQMVDIIGDRVGQLGKNGEYWMGRKGSDLI
jgi:hypothetical protein